MRGFLIGAGLLVPALAFAEPSIEIKDRGDFTEVIAHGVMSKKTAISPIRQRLEIPLAGVVAVKRVIPTGDPTIQLAEVDNESHVLSVKLTMVRDDVKTLAHSAQAQQIGDDLHVMIPRKIPADGAVIKLPEPTLTVAPAIAAAATIAAVKDIAPVKPAAEPVKAAAAPAAEPAKEPAKEIDMTPAAPAVADAKPDAGSDAGSATKKVALGKVDPVKPVGMPEEPGGQAMTYGALALALIGSIFWLVRKRKAGAATGLAASTIDVVAQRSLGGKAKIVWLTAGGRDLMVAVTAQQVRMLGQWPRSEGKGQAGFAALDRAAPPAKPKKDKAPAPVPFGARAALAAARNGLRNDREPRLAEGTEPGLRLVEDDGDGADAPAPEPITPASPAIQGLMRLRQKAAPPAPPPGSYVRQKRESFAALAINEDVATDDIDADAEWAKEILAATNGRTR